MCRANAGGEFRQGKRVDGITSIVGLKQWRNKGTERWMRTGRRTWAWSNACPCAGNCNGCVGENQTIKGPESASPFLIGRIIWISTVYLINWHRLSRKHLLIYLTKGASFDLAIVFGPFNIYEVTRLARTWAKRRTKTSFGVQVAIWMGWMLSSFRWHHLQTLFVGYTTLFRTTGRFLRNAN